MILKIVVFIFGTLFVHANPSPTSTLKSAPRSKENYTDIIKKAQDLVLSQDRVQAVQILNRAIKKEQVNKKARVDLLKLLDEITTTFHGEKNQKTYEYAKTLIRESPQEAQEKLTEVQQAEPTNIDVLIQLGRVALQSGKCEQAEQEVEKIRIINSYNIKGKLLSLQSDTCLQRTEEIDSEMQEIVEILKSMPLFTHVVLAQHFYNKQDYLRAQVELQKATAIDPNYPEIYFWESQIQKKMNAIPTSMALKYIRLCKTITKKDLRKYDIEPRVCQELKNYETEYKAELEKEEKREI